jgi:predicted phosphodiesterase
MKILIFSDTHLSDIFDPKKFQYLSTIIQHADQVIINGDFWDMHACSFTSFIESEWNKLFPLLKEKHAVYIYGNHDLEEASDERRSLFSDTQSDTYTLHSGTSTFHLEHGHRIISIISEDWDKQKNPNPHVVRILNTLQQNLVKARMARVIFQHYNKRIKKRVPTLLNEGEILVCGHTHCAEIDLNHRFVNSGLNHFGIGQYVIIEDGMVTSGEEWY